MSDPTMDNLVLERLREIRTLLGEVKEDTADTRLRVGMLEAGYASVSLRRDRILPPPPPNPLPRGEGENLDVKRRLDLADAPG